MMWKRIEKSLTCELLSRARFGKAKIDGGWDALVFQPALAVLQGWNL